ncbi:MAG TPA: glycerophosphodiester phosphodiesterase family protein [Nevskiaceae bacterium]|nr:glycerophosphodiester phosphodiesterase family protein [Nevskiaceae bacterium]
MARGIALGFVVVLAGCGGDGASSEASPSASDNFVSPLQLHKPVVIADEGDCYFAPENTMVAVRNGQRQGADVLEADLNMTSDGELVLIHDGTLDRTTDCTGAVNSHTLAEVRACDAAFWWVPGTAPGLGGLVTDPTRDPNDGQDYAMRGKGVRIPTAREFFQFAVDQHLPLIAVEIKNIPYDANFDPQGHAMADVLVPLIHEYGLQHRIIVESFWPTSLQRVKALDPEIVTSFLTLGSATENYAYVAASDTDHSSSDILPPDFNQLYVNNVHALGKLAMPWAVDAPADFQRMVTLGVDGAYTCHTTCMLQTLGRETPSQVVTPEAGVSYDVPACQ